MIDVELSSDEETHSEADIEPDGSSDDSFNNITVTVTHRHRTGRSRPRVSTSTRDSSRSASPPRSILSEDDHDHNEQHHVESDIYTDGNVTSDSEFSEVEPIDDPYSVAERLAGSSPPESPILSESASIPPSPPEHYAYSDHERDLDAPTEDELEDAFQQHLEEEIVSSIRGLRQVAGPSGSGFRGVEVYQVVGDIMAGFPGQPAEMYGYVLVFCLFCC